MFFMADVPFKFEWLNSKFIILWNEGIIKTITVMTKRLLMDFYSTLHGPTTNNLKLLPVMLLLLRLIIVSDNITRRYSTRNRIEMRSKIIRHYWDVYESDKLNCLNRWEFITEKCWVIQKFIYRHGYFIFNLDNKSVILWVKLAP